VRACAVAGALDEGSGELLEQAVPAEQVFRLLVVPKQLVEQLRSDRWHNQVSFRDGTVDYRHLHRI
jgi:hypothetical protein